MRRTGKNSAGKPDDMDLPSLVRMITAIDHQLFEHATKAVNMSLTLRNWLIGLSIQTYELGGKDRATYGDRLFSKLSGDLTARGISNCSRRQLYRYRDFYLAYPHIVLFTAPTITEPAPSPESTGPGDFGCSVPTIRKRRR